MNDKTKAADKIIKQLQEEAEKELQKAIYKGLEQSFYKSVKGSIRSFDTKELRIAMLTMQRNVIEKVIDEIKKGR